MEALILVVDMAMMFYLCWRLFKGQGKVSPDLGLLRFEELDHQR